MSYRQAIARLRVLVIAAVSIAVVGCGSATSTVAPSAASTSGNGADLAGALQLAGPWATYYTYTLNDLSSCHITDALTVIKNRLTDPVRLTSVRVSVLGDSPGRERIAAAVTKYKANTTTGAIAPSSTLSPLQYHRLLPAVGATLAPFGGSNAWYEVVLHIDVLGAHPNKWSIDGISVGYTVGNQKFAMEFPQSVKLAAIRTCPA
jgi:hypothetical protein